MSLDELQDVPARGAEVPPRRTAGGWAALRPLLLRMHFYAGLLIAPLLFIAAATGLLYAASWQAEKIVYADELTVPRVGERALPLSTQVRAAREAEPGVRSRPSGPHPTPTTPPGSSWRRRGSRRARP